MSVYTVDSPESSELDKVVEILEVAVVNTNKPVEGQARDRRRVKNNVELADTEGMLVVLRCDGEIVGAMVLQDRKGMCIIIHSNILEKHKKRRGSAMLLDYVLNEVFAEKDVYIIGVTDEYRSMVESVDDKVYKIKDSVKASVHKFTKR